MSTQINVFHYPPQLFDLVVQTIPVLCRGKKDVLLFFQGAGVPETLLSDIRYQLILDKESVNKYEITRTILSRINEQNEKYLGQRRELLKRISEFESFGNCWPKDQYAAKGYVAEIRTVIQTKDAFTRIDNEREKELAKHRKAQQEKLEKLNARNEACDKIKNEFYALFGVSNPQDRGKKLESVLNSLFKHFGLLIREAFTISGINGEGIIEQIDGVVEIDNQIYLVEMKWLKSGVSNGDVFQHLGRMFSRPRPNGIFISASGFTDSAILASKDALARNGTLVLMNLEEIVKVLEHRADLTVYLREKITRALVEKETFFTPQLSNFA